MYMLAVMHTHIYIDVESIQFSSISYTVEEGAGFIALTIVRTGNISQERIIAVSLRDVPDSAEGELIRYI